MNYKDLLFTALVGAPLLTTAACAGDDATVDGDDTSSTDETSDTGDTGDGDGDPTGDGDGDPTGDGDGDPTGDGDGDANNSVCDQLQGGLNAGFLINGVSREFYIDLPSGAESDGPWPIVFNWHGLGDTASNFRQLVSGAVDDPSFSFIAVTPEDTNAEVMIPFVGNQALDWDVFAVDDGNVDDNLEVALFDRVLECADQRWGVDAERVHSMGFSLGGVTTDLLATVRGDQLASVATWSGGLWSNPVNIDMLLGMVVSWPPYVVTNEYPQLIFHGGETDLFEVVPAVYSMSFYDFALNDVTFLNDRGHDVVVCDHGGGHTVPQSAGPQHVLGFFAAHPMGVDTTWADSLPGSLPDFCAASPAP